MAAAVVTVLAPNGRRQTVKVSPRTPLLQVLEDVCRRQELRCQDFGLRFQRTVLDLSVQWRFANLPNNAKLEMIAAPCWRGGTEGSVAIAFLLEDGSRLQDDFHCEQTLWELLCHFPQTRMTVNQSCESTPSCLYMRDEVKGEAELRKATLKSLGLTGGNAVLRFVMKTANPNEPKVMAHVSEEPFGIVRESSPGPGEFSETAGEQDAKLLCCSHADDGRTLMPQTQHIPLKSGQICRRDDDDDSLALSFKEEARELASEVGQLPPQEAAEAASSKSSFVPFFGVGQRLGGASVNTECDVPPSVNLPTSVSSPGGPSKPKKTKGSLEEQDGLQLTEREPVVCHLDLEEPCHKELLGHWPEDLPDEFFEVTVDDVRKRFAQLKSERKRLEESPFMTRSLRESRMKEKLEQYPKVVLRVQFPDRYVLQGFFRPNETVHMLKEFVRSHLADADLPFYLFITPPRSILQNESETLFQANLFPAAVVHFGSEVRRDNYLRKKLQDLAVSPTQADILVARSMPRSRTPAAVENETELEEVAAVDRLSEYLDPAVPGEVPQPIRSDPGKVPKWLKLPGKK
ncbi:tether containing UBX domain for GLUT4 isoform X2 [Microcaecilia unicolor]|uniref:Tether containing UBX domain for GLUT4 isoform X2 n=1 Tax=Microcaecilia unicolor TaxID=1415580 RepID=A0A6P7Y7U2_9AMPH|nr:tether containing UBX domain for GLUT4 isoform X2 [Microcaecilia unicolor]